MVTTSHLILLKLEWYGQVFEEGTRQFMRLRWGKDEENMALLCNKTRVSAIKNLGLEFCAIKAGIQQLSISGDLTSDVFSLQISLCPHRLCMQTHLYTALRSVLQTERFFHIKCVETAQVSTRNIFIDISYSYCTERLSGGIAL